MRRRILFLVFIVVCFLVTCQFKNPISHSEGGGNTESTIDIYDFSFIELALHSKKKQDVDDLIKIYFIENDSSLDTGFGVDIENKLVYIDPRVGSRGIRRSSDDPDEINNVEDFINLVEKYEVQNWKKRYADHLDVEDGYGWKLILQYADGSIQTYSGSGIDMEKITPSNFNSFKKDLAETVEKGLVETE